MSRSRVVAGSLLGAFMIHVAFVACSSPQPPAVGDGGVLTKMMDVLGMEVRDAQAQDATTGACSCPPGPAGPAGAAGAAGPAGPMGPAGPTNVFSAAFSVASGVCTTERRSSNWIVSCVRRAAGSYQLVLNPAATVGTPICSAVSFNGFQVVNINPSFERILVDLNPGTDGGFSIICQSAM